MEKYENNLKPLFVIGNGFDLYSGLQTSYRHFHNYIAENFPDLAQKFEEYFLFETDDNYLWKNFENDLATFNSNSFFNEFNHIDTQIDSFRLSEGFGLEDEISEEVDNLIEGIKYAFTQWIEELEIPADKQDNFQFPPDARFITFNYTPTLELLFSVSKKQILYIHNNLTDYQGELIFGHGQEEDNQPEIEELDADRNSNRTIFTDSENAARYPFYALKKNTEAVLTDHQSYFYSLGSCTEIIVLGHSLGTVDMPYFTALRNLLPQINWKISYYSEQEREELKIRAVDVLGLSKDKIEMITIVDYIKRISTSRKKSQIQEAKPS